MKRLSAVAITLIFLASLMIIIPQSASGITAESGGSVPVTLYWHNGSAPNMDTKTPTASSDNATTAVLNDGGSKTFETITLEKSLTVDTSKICNVSFWITVRVGNTIYTGTDYASVNLTFSLEDTLSRATTAWHSGATAGINTQYNNINLNFIQGWSGTFSTGTLKLKISSQASVSNGPDNNYAQALLLAGYNVTITYDSIDYPSGLSFWCNPVNTTIGTYDANTGEVKTEFEPNIISSKALIKFKGIIQSAFGDDDIDYVHLRITGPQGFSNNTNLTSELGIRADSYEYLWNYSKYSSNLKASTYIANLTVKTVQNTFYRTANFSFSAYGVYITVDKPDQLILPGGNARYDLKIINTGATLDIINIEIAQLPYPYGVKWNVSPQTPPPIPTGNLNGGEDYPLSVVVAPPSNITEGWCQITVHAKSSNSDKYMDISRTTSITKPYEVNLTWTHTYPQNYPVVSGYMYKFGILVTNKGGSTDTFTLEYTPASGWNIVWEYHPQFVTVDAYTVQCDMGSYGTTGSSAVINLTVNATAYGGKEVIINITGKSTKWTPGNGTRYSNLTLSLTRLLGIDIAVAPSSDTVYVKNSDGSAQYTITITTSDDTGYTVGLNALKGAGIKFAVLDDESISVSNTNPGSATLTVTLAKGTAYGSYIATVEATIAGMPMYKKSITTTTTAVRYYGVNMTTDGELVRTAAAGEQIEYILRVKNTGNDNAFITLGFPKGSELCELGKTTVSLGPGKETNVTLTIAIPSDAKDGQKITVSIDATSGSDRTELTFEITVEKTDIGILIDILYDMSHFIILLIAVIVVFAALWIKRRK